MLEGILECNLIQQIFFENISLRGTKMDMGQIPVSKSLQLSMGIADLYINNYKPRQYMINTLSRGTKNS